MAIHLLHREITRHPDYMPFWDLGWSVGGQALDFVDIERPLPEQPSSALARNFAHQLD
jgi:hypothetical protein